MTVKDVKETSQDRYIYVCHLDNNHVKSGILTPMPTTDCECEACAGVGMMPVSYDFLF